ncbi:hypothetical protein [Rhodococcus qingshengii]|uniref:hypothetical protein n=1 Tax=Rhodococcus qingshengii TaxID=334542 RepID=UPI0035137AA0
MNPVGAEVEPSALNATSDGSAPRNWQLTGTELDRATTLLETLPVKGRAPKTGYSRDQFGVAWTDDVDVEFGHNGCDTRNDVLTRDLANVAFKNGEKQCTVLSGVLHDPYTATTINFQRGQTTSSAVQIDHVLSAALSRSLPLLAGHHVDGMALIAVVAL